MKNLLTAPNLLMLGVVAVGGFAAYRLFKGKEEDPAKAGLALLGDPLHLTQGRYYHARLRVHSLGLPPFLANASREELVAALRVLGFNDVRVFMSASELPSSWPKSTIGKDNETARWFEARWTQETVNLPRPADIELMWIAPPPPQQPAVSGVGRPRKDGGLYGNRYSYGRDLGRGLDKVDELLPSDFDSQWSKRIVSP